MTDISLIVGELRAHRKAQEKRMDALDEGVNHRFDKVEKQIEDLKKWKWKVAGGAAAATAIAGVLLTLVKMI